MVALRLGVGELLSFLTDQARENQLRLVDLLVLARAVESDGIVPGEAGAALGLRSSTMTAVSDRLDGKRLIRRLPHPTDGRLVLLRATPRGLKLIHGALGPAVAAVAELIGQLGSAERRTLGDFATDVTALLARERHGPGL